MIIIRNKSSSDFEAPEEKIPFLCRAILINL